MKTTIHSKYSRQRGFSLIEALVGFLILSIGMLGIASLQVISLKAGKTATLRTVAVIKIEDMMERIRNNPRAVVDYAVGTGGLGTESECNDYGGVIGGNSCSGTVLAKDDIFYWKRELTDSLPAVGTTAEIQVDAPVPGTQPTAIVTIIINWKERDPEAEAMIDMSYSSKAYICDSTQC